MGVATGCGCKEVYRFPHTTYPYSSCICSFYTRVKYCAHFRVAPALIACKHVHVHTNVERWHITRLMISGAKARRIVLYANARPQSFTLREEARSCLAALSQLSRSTLLPVIVEMHLVSGYYTLKLYSFHMTHPRRKALPYVT